MTPRLHCAWESPWSAAFRNHTAASLKLWGAPWPCQYMLPRLYCA
eukprot:CAMPEP_0172584384 /NCGR_PEP_ID=MMETSP1068-20121228/3977_1 /TAXON_ID=35684 /ORGANISM="Pseudopedinella elastica, Strain CCMP716" /LENGTH=44 /DNA_ID= /DNA_START= /DNA_END= /DNA_ORIENTATION=